MFLLDVNVLIYAHRTDVDDHPKYRAWLEDLASGDNAFGLADLALSGFVRVATHPKVWKKPSPLQKALAFVDELRAQPNAVVVAPGPRHWGIFVELCRNSGAKGNKVPDAYYAAIAIEHGCEWVTTDSGFGAFTGLRWRHPLR